MTYLIPTPSGELPARFEPSNLVACLLAWADQNPLSRFPWIVEGVEVPFACRLHPEDDRCACTHALALHHGFKNCKKCSCPVYKEPYLSGVKDLVGRMKDDPKRVIVVDHKTTSTLDRTFLQQFQLDSQFTGYIWAENQVRKCRTAYVNVFEIMVLPSANKKCPKHGVKFTECGPEHLNAEVKGPITRTRQQIDEWHSMAVELTARFWHSMNREMNAVTTEGRWNGGCRWCELKEWCIADRPLSPLSGWFEKRRWEPWKVLKQDLPAHVLYVDNSTLKSVATCTTQARVRYGVGYTTKQQSLPLDAGTAVHKFFESYFKGEGVKKAIRAFRKSYPIKEGARE